MTRVLDPMPVMWKPDRPIEVEGRILSDEEAWWFEFTTEFYALTRGEIDDEWLAALTATLYQRNGDANPKWSAGVVYELLQMQIGDSAADEQHMSPWTPSRH
ncbi:hypothetical protein [Variovorax paradoxus]|uniref:Uncharacterized protein n=1 Tax=Variovorax paradoxus TaxID=34073 RepID=A0A679J9Y2_VARPD|nr:hypothetical protein VVAX_06818 [Variovorax paradoxus]